MLTKDSSPPIASSGTHSPVTSEPCPPGLLKTPQEAAAQPTPPDAIGMVADSTAALTPAEHTQLHVRVIALENLVIALLASATEHQLECAREMATFISPRAGATPHELTTHAAAEMLDMVERAVHFRGAPPR